MNVNQYFEQAQLALAAYALQLTSDATNGQFINALKTAGMTEEQATRFAARYEIIHSQQNTSNGFAATLFRERATSETLAAGTVGQYHLAVRGTEFDIDKVNDLIIADAGGIAANGLARDQIVDMYNYYQKLITSTNSTVAQWVKKAETGPDGQPIYYYEKTGAALGLGKLTATTPLTVAGHSLGGHLAAAFTRLFPASTAYAFNGAGFYETSYVNNFFDQLAGHATAFDPSRIKNIYGDAGEEVITNAWRHTQYGERIPVFIENQLQVPSPPLAFNHSMAVLSDAMALYDLFARIDRLRVSGISRHTSKPWCRKRASNPPSPLPTSLKTCSRLSPIF